MGKRKSGRDGLPRRTRCEVVLLVVACLLLAAAPECFAEQRAFMPKDGDTIVFLGDSITQAGTEPLGYITLFRLACDVNGYEVKVVNAGISGHKSNDMLARLQRDVIDRHPTWVSISCGVNDVWHGERGVPLTDYRENMTEILEKCLAAGIKVVLLTATPIFENPKSNENQKLADYNEFLRELAKTKNVVLCDLNRAFMSVYVKKATNGNVLTTDGVHMNPRGNRLMAREIFRALGATQQEVSRANSRWEFQGNI